MVAAFEFNTVRGTYIISVYLGGVNLLGGSIVTPGVEFVTSVGWSPEPATKMVNENKSRTAGHNRNVIELIAESADNSLVYLNQESE